VVGNGPGKLEGGNTVALDEGIGEITLDAGAVRLHDAHPGCETAEGTATP